MAYDDEINKSRKFLLEIYPESIEQQHITKILHETHEWKAFRSVNIPKNESFSLL